MKKTLLALATCLALVACDNDGDVVSRNISTDAANFKVQRRIVFYNGVTGDYVLELQGLCTIETHSRELSVTCKVGPGEYKKHYLGLSNNVTFFAEQMDAVTASPYFYRVIFKPLVIVPSIEVR